MNDTELVALTADKARLDYLAHCTRLADIQMEHSEQYLECGGLPVRDFLVLAQDGTTCWGKTYREAIDEAMKHDGYKT